VDGGINNLFDNYFLQGLSLYIDDMRILKNIYNEFIVYYDKIRSIELDNNKLLAIIVYKNLFPRDFSELQLSRGYVFSVLDGKNTYIQDEIQKINRQIEKIEERIKIATQENLESLDELDTLFLRISPRLNFQIDGGVHYDLQSNIAIVKAMKKSPDNIQIFFNNNSDRMPFDIKNAINSLNENQEYLKRKGIINDKSAKNLNELTQKKQDLQEVSGNIAGKHLKDIINRDNVDIIFKEKSNSEADNQKLFQDIISNDYYPLIKYLIRNGYIDETYSDYMTYFYENSISKEDKIFLRSVADELAKGCDFKLKNPKLIVSRLQATDFEHEETLNFDLLAYLLKNREASSLYIKKLIGQLKKNNNALFVSQFLERRSDLEAFFAVLVDNWPNIADVYLNSFDTNKKQREDFSIDAVNYLPDSKIVKLNINNVLSNFISEFSEFLNQKDCDIDKIIKGLKILSVKFVRINPDGLNVDFIDGVYQNDMYQINFDNISFILNTIYKREKSDDFKHKNYSLVRSKQNEPLNKYIQENINDYMNIVIKNSDNSISDDEKCAIQILNNKNIDMTIKDRYISILTTVISDITEIEDNGLWDNLIENNIAENSENNIFAYYFSNENGLNETLIDFINKHEGTFTISEEDIDNDYGEGSTSKFVDNVIECDELKDDIYENILRSSGYEYDDFSIKEVSSSKILILVNIELILMTKENLLLFRENYPKQKIFFITKNIDKYIELLDDSIMINEEILCLLEENISDEAKLKLLNKTNGEISIKGKKYSESVMIQILKNNFDINEIPLLLKSFDNESKNIKEIIFNIISNNIDFLLENETPISFEILRSILNLAEIDRDTKKNLFVMHLLNINENQIKECFELMGMTDYLSLFEHKRPKFLIDPINERILTGLKEKKVIKSFKPDQKNTDYYRAY
jgi:hypothetical protein